MKIELKMKKFKMKMKLNLKVQNENKIELVRELWRIQNLEQFPHSIPYNCFSNLKRK